jgi:4'-phosphopantetheinyl transferase EntD
MVTLHVRHFDSSLCHPCELSEPARNLAPKRQKEFLLGRCAAHIALRRCGAAAFDPILPKKGREPGWPSGFVGSITHCGDWAVAAVSRRQGIRSIGIDLEDSQAIPVDEIIGTVCTAAERSWVLDGGYAERKLAAVFSAKETVYKALFPICETFFDFHAVELFWRPESHAFWGTVRRGLTSHFPPGYSVRIGCQWDRNLVFTHAVIPD